MQSLTRHSDEVQILAYKFMMVFGVLGTGGTTVVSIKSELLGWASALVPVVGMFATLLSLGITYAGFRLTKRIRESTHFIEQSRAEAERIRNNMAAGIEPSESERAFLSRSFLND